MGAAGEYYEKWLFESLPDESRNRWLPTKGEVENLFTEKTTNEMVRPQFP